MKTLTLASAEAAQNNSPIQWAVLGLVIERPSYGYEIAARFSRIYDGILDTCGSHYIYTTLRVLQERNLVQQRPGKARGLQPKPEFHATDAGLRSYKDMLVAEFRGQQRRTHTFAHQLAALGSSPQDALDVIDRHADACLEAGEQTPVEQTGQPLGRSPLTIASYLIAADARLGLRTRLAWLDCAREEFEALLAGKGAGNGTA